MYQQLVVLNFSVSIDKIQVTEFISVKVSRRINLMQNTSTQSNQQLSRYEQSRLQNIPKEICTFTEIQWNLYKADTIGAKKRVRFKEMPAL